MDARIQHLIDKVALRDKQLADLQAFVAGLQNQYSEEVGKFRDEYEKRINSLQQQLSRANGELRKFRQRDDELSVVLDAHFIPLPAPKDEEVEAEDATPPKGEAPEGLKRMLQP